MIIKSASGSRSEFRWESRHVTAQLNEPINTPYIRSFPSQEVTRLVVLHGDDPEKEGMNVRFVFEGTRV